MEIVQLWGLQDVYDYIYENILDPVWEFVSSLISSGFTYLVNGLSIALNAILNSIFGEIISIFLDWFYAKWFALQSAILLLLDCIEDCFNIVSGLRPVYIRAGGGAGKVTSGGMPLLFAVFQQKSVQNAITVMMIVGFWLCFAMAILATARTFFELGDDKTKPVTHVIKMTAKSLLYLILAPMTAAALILLSQAILTTIDRGLTEGEGKTSVARIIFCISSLDAIDTSITSDGYLYNVSYADGPSKASLTDKYRREYYYEDDHFLIPNFVNPIKVRTTFTFWGFDYFISLGCGIFFTVVMCMVLAVFIGRVFDVIVLLVIEPFFVAMMPFDDGEYYRKWFELFLGKLFQGFGSVVGMRVYLMILEQLFAGNISFSNSNSLGARLQDYLIMLLFAMGGGVAVQHVGPLITGILSQAAASGEQTYAAAGGAVGKYIANKEMGIVKKAAKSTAKKIGGGLGMGLRDLSKFMGKRGAGAAGAAGGPGGMAGGPEGMDFGKFGGMRPNIGGGGKAMGGIPGGAGGAVSSAQQALGSFRTSVMGAGLMNTNPKGTGQDKGKKDGKGPGGIGGVRMEDVLKGGANGGKDQGGGGFTGGSGNPGSGGGGSIPPLRGNMGGGSTGSATMQQMVGGGSLGGGGSTGSGSIGGGSLGGGSLGGGGSTGSGSIGGGSFGGGGSTGSGSLGGGSLGGGGSTGSGSTGSGSLGGGSTGNGSLGGGSMGSGSTGSGQVTMQDVVGNNGGYKKDPNTQTYRDLFGDKDSILNVDPTSKK